MKITIFILLLLLLISTASAGKIQYKYKFSGQSMYPAIKTNVEKFILLNVTTVTNKIDIKVGDIIMFNHDHRDYINGGTFRYICHRIIEYDYPMICTKGDNNIDDDNCVRFSDVAFKVHI